MKTKIIYFLVMFGFGLMLCVAAFFLQLWPFGKSGRILMGGIQSGLALNRPIEFYGRVIDQDHNAVDDVKVHLDYETYSIAYGGVQTYHAERVTDSDGKFYFGGVNGTNLLVTAMEKSGFKWVGYPDRIVSYAFSSDSPKPYVANPKLPEILNIWKSSGVLESLIEIKGSSDDTAPSGEFLDIDLSGGTVRAGDLPPDEYDCRLGVQYPKPSDDRAHYDWGYVVEVPNGGLIATDDSMLYRAPVDGYLPRFEFHMSSTDPHWKNNISQKFYLKSRNGRCFGAIELDVNTSRLINQHSFAIGGRINPHGSRNLEPGAPILNP